MSAGSGIIWRILERNTEVGGYAIPRGATVVAPIACIHHDAKHWPEPERFLPSRFLKGDSLAHLDRRWHLQHILVCPAHPPSGYSKTSRACLFLARSGGLPGAAVMLCTNQGASIVAL